MEFIEQAGIDFTPLDHALCQIDELQTELVVARMGNIPDAEKHQAAELIKELKQELATVNAVSNAVKNSRDSLQFENNELKRQCLMQRKEINKLKALQAV